MNKYSKQLRECPDCGNDDISWCGISHRPYCECGRWGKTNFGSDQDAIDDWNKKTEHELLLEAREENAQLKSRIAELELVADSFNRFRASLCDTCGGYGSVGSAPDDYYDCPECTKRNNQIKADAIREMLRYFNNFSLGWAKDGHGNVYWLEKSAEEYADAIERGES